MTLKRSILLTYTSLLVLFVSSCHTKENSNLNDQITWQHYTDSLSYTDPESKVEEDSMRTSGPAFFAEVDLLIPQTEDKGLTAVIDSLRQYISYRVSGAKMSGRTVEEIASQRISDLLEEHKMDISEAKKMMRQGSEDMDLSSSLSLFVMQNSIVDSLAFNSKNIISIVSVSDEYNGGAHGQSACSALNYDLELNTQITFDALFNPNSEEAVTQLIQKELMVHFSVNTPEELEGEGVFNYENAKVSENFYFSADGITFFFNPYDIAVYFLGTIKITIPYSHVSAYLQEPYKKLAQ